MYKHTETRPDLTQLSKRHESLSLYGGHFAADSKGMTTFSPSGSEHPSAVFCRHPLPETMLVPSFSIVRLKCPFHLVKLLSNCCLK
jgi:hypothetical protein